MTIDRDLAPAGAGASCNRTCKCLLQGLFVAVMQIIVATAALHMAFYPLLETPARASVEGAMNDYFDEMGAAANITGPTAYEGQSGGYYTAGNVMMRFPQKSVNIANLQLPNVRAGCGGIDIFAGSFSFINSAEIIALLKAIANNSLGFAFQLAIDTLCPECGKVMEQMRQATQLLNQQMMNSCETAQALVGNVWPKIDASSRAICEAIGTNDGFFSDWAKSRQGCGTDGTRNSTVAGASDEFDEVNAAVPRNFTWEALKKNALFAPGGVVDQDLAEYVMTLVGTVIIIPPADGSAGSYRPFFADTSSTLFSALLDGTPATPITVLTCDEPVNCLNPTTTTRTVATSAAIRPKVRAIVLSMMEKVVSDTALDAGEQGLLQAASLPLYKIITVRAAYARGTSVSDIDSLAEITAVDIVYGITDQLISQVNGSKSKFIGGESDEVAKWATGLREVQAQLQRRRSTSGERVTILLAFIENTQMMERTIQANLTPSWSASLDWSRAVKGRGGF